MSGATFCQTGALWLRCAHLKTVPGERGVEFGEIGLHEVEGRVGIGLDCEFRKLEGVARQCKGGAAECAVSSSAIGNLHRQFDARAGDNGPHFRGGGKFGTHANENFHRAGVEVGHNRGVGVEIQLHVGTRCAPLTAGSDGKLVARMSDVDGEPVCADFVGGRVLDQVVGGRERGGSFVISSRWRVIAVGGKRVVATGIQLILVAVFFEGEARVSDGLVIDGDLEFGFFFSCEGHEGKESQRQNRRPELYTHGEV